MPGGDDNKDDPWPEELYPPELVGTAQEPGIMVKGEFAVSGGSYWPMPPKNFFPPRLPLFPHRGNQHVRQEGLHMEEQVRPVHLLGDPPKYEPCFWQKKDHRAELLLLWSWRRLGRDCLAAAEVEEADRRGGEGTARGQEGDE